jgi:hypothetical protein
LLIYSLDDSITFDPFELDVDITPATILETLHEREITPLRTRQRLVDPIFEVRQFAAIVDQLARARLDQECQVFADGAIVGCSFDRRVVDLLARRLDHV